MTTVKDLKSRIKGVLGTQKITKAMKTISLIRLIKAEERAISSKPYIYAVSDIVSHIQAGNIYFRGNKSKNSAFVIFTSDRGLCGAFNDNLLKAAEAVVASKKETGAPKLILIGTKAITYFNKKKYDIYSRYSQLPSSPTISLSNLVMADCKKLFLDGEVGEVFLIYNNFKSKLKYEIKVKRMLPVTTLVRPGMSGIKPLYLFEPNKRKMVDLIMEMYLESTVFHSFLDLYASEYTARYTAMAKATDSAMDMINDLTLEMNKTRQAQITKEILEVVSGAEAIRK